MTLIAATLTGLACVTGTVTFVAHNRPDTGVVKPSDGSPARWFSGFDTESRSYAGLIGTDELKPGDRVVVSGEVRELGFAPGLADCRVEFLDHGTLAPAPSIRLRDLDWGRMDNERVALGGVLTSVAKSVDEGYSILKLATMDGMFAAEVRTDMADWPGLVDAELWLEGVASCIFNIRREFVGVQLRVTSADNVHVVERTGDPFARPLTALDRILPYSPDGIDLHRRHVRGVVTYVKPGAFLWLAADGATLRLDTADTEAAPGDEVEAVGFAAREGGLGRLSDAVLRRVGRAEPPTPVRVGHVQLAGYPFDESGRFHNYDGRRVVCTGELLSCIDSGGGTTMMIGCEGVRVDVEVDGVLNGLTSNDVAWGPTVEVTGVLELQQKTSTLDGALPAIAGWRLLVSAPEDVVVVRNLAWRAHQASEAWRVVFFALICLLMLALEAGIVVIVRTRRQRRELDILAAERKRMAADLHDTLEQQLASARLVLNSSIAFSPDVPEVVKSAVEEANAILAHAKSEMRARILNMRSDFLFTQGPEKVLSSIAKKVDGTGGVKVRTNLRGLPEHLAESVFSELVFIVGEAITNAVKHGHCKTIVLASDPVSDGFTLSVANDGEPFDPDAALGPEAGHYGLVGMRERAKRADIGMAFVHEGRWMILRLAVKA